MGGKVRRGSDASAQELQDSAVDLHVGARIRTTRRSRGCSQDALAEAVGLTFQQVQKYEKGVNRVSASKLYGIARALQVPVEHFFEGLPDPRSGQVAEGTEHLSEGSVRAFLNSQDGLRIALQFPQIPNALLRRAIVELVSSSAQPSGTATVP